MQRHCRSEYDGSPKMPQQMISDIQQSKGHDSSGSAILPLQKSLSQQSEVDNQSCKSMLAYLDHAKDQAAKKNLFH